MACNPVRNRITKRIVASLVLFLLLASSGTSGQAVERRIDTSQCRECRLSVTRIATLGSLADSVSPNWFGLRVVPLEPGFLVSSSSVPNRLLRYDERGRLLGTIGRPGSGPGEYQLILEVTPGNNDSIFVLDASRRVTVLDSKFRAARTFNLPLHPRSAAVDAPGDLVITATDYSRERAGWPLHLLRADGQYKMPFGKRNPTIDPNRPSVDRRKFTILKSGDIIASRPDRYRLELYRPDGTHIGELVRNAPWFPDRSFEAAAYPNPPSPFIEGLAAFTTDLVLVAAVVPEVPTHRSIQRGEGHPTTVTHLNRLYDSIIEIINPASGKLVKAVRIDGYVIDVVSPNIIATAEETQEGLVRIHVWRVDLTR